MDIKDVASQNLHTLYLATEEEIRSLNIRIHEIEQELLARMQTEGATAIPGVCELEQKTTYDQTAYTPMKELLSDEDLAKVFTPGHEGTVWVPDRWKPAGQVNAMARRYGNKALACVENARIPQPPRAKIIRSEEKSK